MRTKQKSVRVFEITTDNYDKVVGLIESKYILLRKYLLLIKTNNEKISFAIHKGLDLASFRHAKIYLSNRGKVIYEGFNAIYGNTLAIYHILGMVTTYSHCSSFNVKEGDILSKGIVIANTGNTGAVFGDHLHFGIYIQGIAVQPIEWIDSHWIKDNIIKVIIDAKRIINR